MTEAAGRGPAARVAVVDVGSNSTRLLVCDVRDGRVVAEHHRTSRVTRLAEGVDASGALRPEAVARVLAAVDAFPLDAEHRLAVLTSAARDAANREDLLRPLRDRGLDARVVTGEEEAALTYAGAVSERDPGDRAPLLVVDIGGGSTELVLGEGPDVRAAASLQLGVVRLAERHLHDDPPTAGQLAALREDARRLLRDRPPEPAPARALGVAGTATQLASVDGGQPHGHVLRADRVEALLARLAALPLAERRAVPGLDPARAPVVVAGAAILAEVLAAYGLTSVEASTHDLLRGAALRCPVTITSSGAPHGHVSHGKNGDERA